MQSYRDSKTASEQIAMAEKIFQEVLASRIDHKDLSACANLLANITEKHRDFFTTHPVIVRYMCYMRSYDSNAFAGYLAKISKSPASVTKIDGFLESQADYVVRLARVLPGNKLSGKAARELKREVLGELRQEYSAWENTYNQAKKDIDVQEHQRREAVRKEFRAAISGGVGDGRPRVQVTEALPEPQEILSRDISSVSPATLSLTADDLLGM